MFQNLLLVFLGGGIGSSLRFIVSVLSRQYFAEQLLLGTFIVNILGSFLIGVLTGVAAHANFANDNFKLMFITGFCGGFTTFSTFAFENMKLINSGEYLTAGLYILITVVAGLAAVKLGLELI